MKLWKLAGAALHRFVAATLRDRLPQDHFNDLDPAEYEDQQFSDWYAHLDTVLRDSGIARFTCTCGCSGKQLELKQKRYKGTFYPTCPCCDGFEYQRLGIPDKSETHFTIDRYEGLTKDYVDRMAEQSPESNFHAGRLRAVELSLSDLTGILTRLFENDPTLAEDGDQKSVEAATALLAQWEQTPVQPSDFADREYIRSQMITPAEEQLKTLRIQSLEYSLNRVTEMFMAFYEAHPHLAPVDAVSAIGEAELLLGKTPEQQNKAKINEINEDNPVAHGYARQWLECSECGRLQYYDYIPRSFASPIMTSACGHRMEQMLRL